MAMYKEEIMLQLPKIGDRRMEHPQTFDPRCGTALTPPRPCTVVAVQLAHLWYKVRFDNGICESYKLPHTAAYRGGAI
jgi:hypothetical protein